MLLPLMFRSFSILGTPLPATTDGSDGPWNPVIVEGKDAGGNRTNAPFVAETVMRLGLRCKRQTGKGMVKKGRNTKRKRAARLLEPPV
jgi:hypothetical protein